MAPIVHIVMIKFKPGTQDQRVTDTVEHLLSLKDKCVRPDSKQPYIVSMKGGKNNSPEGFDHGLTHAFVIELESEQDREYYLNGDPAHKEFVQTAVEVLETPTIVDFNPGVY